ncbi:hypothetical protein [Pedobacter alluvionis]|uniref:Uncharacterized protein n=1 Tax=Pedobacter alluvionis TaxID=475253 RepID=A0A497XV70_9SPHI|nr:hypothetical protein [Pedobacter alluvionis]RLJ73645.1 hypothetical protein BCL90_3807 [Pedobacter alluvionis]TFB32729.1 hypothetical protein E3V97_01435 [Pedobacter alluvionis]
MSYTDQELIALLLDENGIHRLPRLEFIELMRKKPYDKVVGKRIIFIDLKYWISFRMALEDDIKMKLEQKILYKSIYENLLELVIKMKVVCVTSDSILTEVEKMPLDRKLGTAKIMDSLHVAVVLNGLNACTFEYINIDLITAGKEPIDQYHLSSVFEANRFLAAVTLKKMENEPDLLYNIMYDSMSEMTVLEYLKETNGDFYDSSEKFAELVNDTKLKDTAKHSYEALLVQGLVSQTESLKKLINYTPISKVNPLENLPLYIYSAPFLYLHSAILAAINIEKARKVQKNDFYDLSHSCIGVGYSDYFFTEKKFHHLLKTKPIDCTAHYKCKLYSDPFEILNVVVNLNSHI